ncbi:MAG: ABC transporter ATP-binding protein [Leucobacter sp.]|nr:ABC transporter ATP-binding protein [Leucobacter sp.]
MSATSILRAEGVRLGYADRVIVDDLHLSIAEGEFTVIIGPNACGKSTVLRALGRMLRPQAGRVLLAERELHEHSAKEAAKHIALLPQSPLVPEALTVADLVARGRYPHQRLLRQWSNADEIAVQSALEQVQMLEHADRFVDELSGGQRQRVWIALSLAQETPILLLDEPTTYLDIAHQIEVLELCAELNKAGRTLVAVLHDLNLAARYATTLVAMCDGRIVSQGTPADVLTPQLLHEVFDLEARVVPDPENGLPMVVPRDRRQR